jgi:Rrf2 family protein
MMKLLTKESDYAARALLYLAQHRDAYVSTRAIARSEEIPEYFLKRIIQTLIKEGLLDAREGAAGGVSLVRDPATIRISDIIALFQGGIQLSECMFRKKMCPNRARCVLRKRVLAAQAKLEREFRKITVQTLLRDQGE